MKLKLPKLNIAPSHFLRQCGYREIQNPHKNNEISYARSLDPGRFYPRFHTYLETSPLAGGENFINLHLDMKKPSYEGTAAHSGEYGGELVAGEARSIQQMAEKFTLKNHYQPIGFPRKKSWWRRLLSQLFKK